VASRSATRLAVVRAGSGRASLALWAVLGAVTLACAVLVAVPWGARRFQMVLDSAWDMGLHAAFAAHRRFGVDLIFTYGPWGFLYGSSYHPDTYVYLAGGWLLVTVATWYAQLRLARGLLPGLAAAVLWLPAALAICLIDSEAAFTAPALLLLVVYFHVEGRGRPFTLALLAVAAALASLVKFTFMVTSLCAVGVVGWHEVVGRRRWPAIASIYGGALVGFLLLGGQSLRDFPAYLRGASEIANGYAEAMAMTGPLDELLWSAAITAVLAVVLAGHEWRRRHEHGLACLAGLAAIVFLGMRGAFVRHYPHAQSLRAPILLAQVGVLYLPVLLAERAAVVTRAVMVGVVVAGLAVASQGLVAADRRSLPRQLADALGSLPARARAAAKVLTGTSSLRADFERNMAALRAENPVPPTTGTVDVYPWLLSVAVAHGLPYAPRPVLQSYSAYTPYLVHANVEHLRGASAPDTIFFDLGTIDGRFPSLDDGASWPDLLTRYDITGMTPGFLLLRRAAAPRTFHLRPLGAVTGRFDRPVPVPGGDGPLWVSLRFRRTLLGDVASVLFKPPPLEMVVVTPKGTRRRYRLPRGIAESGFVLSPVVANRYEFALLAAGETAASSNLEGVVRIRIAPEYGGRLFYHRRFEAAFSRLEFPPQALADVPGVAALLGLEHVARNVPCADLRFGDDGEPVLLAPPPCPLRLPVDAAMRRLHVGFGILDGAWEGKHRTDGVEFRIWGEGRGAPALLWGRTLDPLHRPADRGPQSIELDVPEGTRALRFETLPGKTGLWDWSYWSEAVAGASGAQ
jgi:hypothetical protein